MALYTAPSSPSFPTRILRDVAGRYSRSGFAMEEDLNSFGDAEPAQTVLETERGHGVVSDAGGEDAERAVDRRVGIAADDDLARVSRVHSR